MKTTYIGQQKFIVRGARYFKITDETSDAATQAEWADEVLGRPDVVFMNGKHSHEVAACILEQAEDTLLDHMVVLA